MNQNPTNRFLKITVILLIVVNAVVLFFHVRLLMAEGKRPHPDQLKNRLIHDLKLDATQEQAYSNMVDRHRSDMRNIRKHEEEARIQLYAQPGDTTVDRSPYLHSMGKLREQRELITFNHFMELRAILRPDQQITFDQIIGEAVNGMEPGPPKNK